MLATITQGQNISLSALLVVAAFLLFLIGAFWNPPRVTLGWLGAACLTLALMLS